MLLVVALPDCALRLCKVLTGASYIVAVRDAAELRRRVHGHQPDVVVLDWRMGGSAWRAIDEVPAIVSRTATHPHVIVVAPLVSPMIERSADELGCYEIVSVTDAGWEKDVLEAFSTARLERQESPHPSFRRNRAQLH